MGHLDARNCGAREWAQPTPDSCVPVRPSASPALTHGAAFLRGPAAFCCASLRCAPGPSSQCASAAASERRCATLLSVIAVASLCSYSPWSPRLPLLAALQAARPATLLWAILATARTMVVRAQQRRYGERRTTRRPSTAVPPTADSLRVAADRLTARRSQVSATVFVQVRLNSRPIGGVPKI